MNNKNEDCMMYYYPKVNTYVDVDSKEDMEKTISRYNNLRKKILLPKMKLLEKSQNKNDLTIENIEDAKN
jgi:hypothetical protein